MTPAVFSISETGNDTAAQVAQLIGGELFESLEKEAIADLFAEGRPLVGICAVGILIRLLAPHLADKTSEPPVIAVSQDGKHVVPLLGGHRGANTLARTIAEGLSGTAAITTASETRFARALDDPPSGWTLSEPRDAKPAMIALFAGAKIALTGHAPWLADAGYPISSMGAVNVLISEQKLRVDRGLVYHPRTLVAGVGCARGAPADEIIDLIETTLARENLSPKSLAALGTIDLKADEAGLIAAAEHFGVPLRLFTAAELERERYRLVNPSAVVEAEVGTPGVSEAAALKAGTMVVPKHKSQHATCAIGRSIRPIDVNTYGRARGLLHLVGIGPGAVAQRTGAAAAALRDATDWVGYELYLDLVSDLRGERTEHRFGLGEEEDRVRLALELAGQGKRVALISSGDVQIYAMAALAFELVEATGARALSDSARRVEIAVHPGISALQAASAAAGAMIGHDFCAISLSDLMTPRADIEKRLKAAAAGDFVTAFYNPRSARRTDLIEKAKMLFLVHRPADTPVVVARSLGRPDQRVEVVRLIDFEPEKVDMLTLVMVGASFSRSFRRGDGSIAAYTPRGYGDKVTE